MTKAAGRLSCVCHVFAQKLNIYFSRALATAMPAHAAPPSTFENRRDNALALRWNAGARTLLDAGARTVKKMEERIATMEQQLKALKERHQKAETKRKRDEAQQAKKDDVRRRLLAGTVILEKVEKGEIDKVRFREWLDRALSEAEDRALFDL